MPAQEKKSHLPGIKLSQNIRKAIEKNVGCEEDLIKTLQDVEIKKRAARNEILLKTKTTGKFTGRFGTKW